MGKKHLCFFQTADTGNRTPNSSVKGSGANHYPRAPAQLNIILLSYFIEMSYFLLNDGWGGGAAHISQGVSDWFCTYSFVCKAHLQNEAASHYESLKSAAGMLKQHHKFWPVTTAPSPR